MKEYIEKHRDNAIIAALVVSVLALAGTVLSCYLTYYYNSQSQDRQAKLEQISKFDASSTELVAAAGAFINAINQNDGKELEAVRRKLSQVIASQIYGSQDFTKAYGGDLDDVVRRYQAALAELNNTARGTSSVTDMRPWSESFGRVLDTKATLSDRLYSAMGSRARS
jgi:hypothetical protein